MNDASILPAKPLFEPSTSSFTIRTLPVHPKVGVFMNDFPFQDLKDPGERWFQLGKPGNLRTAP